MAEKARKNFKGSTAALFMSDAAGSAQEAAQDIPTGDLEQLQQQLPDGYRIVKERKSARVNYMTRPQIKEKITDGAQKQGISANEFLDRCVEYYVLNH